MTGPTLPPPHFAVPFTIGADGSPATIAQDSPVEVAQSVRILLSTPIGSRPQVPGYGVRDFTFTNGDTTGMTQAVARWEPRAAGITITARVGEHGDTTVQAVIPERTTG